VNVRRLISEEESNLSKEWTSTSPTNSLAKIFYGKIWGDLQINKRVSSSQQLESAGPQIFVLVKVGPITIGQLIRYIGSQKQFNQTDLLFHSPTKKEDQI
jgi:hypothetical protein